MSKKVKVIEGEEGQGGVAFAAVDPQTGEPQDISVLEDDDVAFDPTRMALDLTKAEKRRTTALMMAIQAYNNIIIKDADYLREAHAQARTGDGPRIRPATMDAMVEAAIQFDAFIAGRLVPRSGIMRGQQSEAPEPDGAVVAVDPVDGDTTK